MRGVLVVTICVVNMTIALLLIYAGVAFLQTMLVTVGACMAMITPVIGAIYLIFSPFNSKDETQKGEQ